MDHESVGQCPTLKGRMALTMMDVQVLAELEACIQVLSD